MELTREKLEEMACVDIRKVDRNSRTDLLDIIIDTKKPVADKLNSFAEQAENIFINCVGEYIVKVSFQKEGPTIDDKMEEYLQRLAQIYI